MVVIESANENYYLFIENFRFSHLGLYRASLSLSHCLNVSNSNAPFNGFNNVLQSYSIFRHVSMLATSIMRESSLTVLSWNNSAIKPCTRSRIHFTVAINVQLGKHRVSDGVTIFEQRKNTVMLVGCYPGCPHSGSSIFILDVCEGADPGGRAV
jgi:hypothetical protein